jgi:hypothetical protein
VGAKVGSIVADAIVGNIVGCDVDEDIVVCRAVIAIAPLVVGRSATAFTFAKTFADRAAGTALSKE